ncbi:hypothetical protein PFLUV_G00172300 [Perca fluviatilis]|uniref:Up-regulator of cell proliferation-like domain-containing protein n=1 Tax=Perca fluviatilis TaxID=8168 RepID=A0A6A5DVR1_PERFL|nr:hypothetical protein PFLUV_G00172300 [Perca fluviatilis]
MQLLNLSSFEIDKVEELEENSAEIKSDPVNEPGEGEHSEKNDDNTGGESANNEKGEADEVKDVSNESSSKMTEGSMEESDAVKDTSPTSQTVSTATKELEELEENSAEIKSDPVNEPGEGEHSEKNDDNTGGESENTSVPSANNVKGRSDKDTSGNQELMNTLINDRHNTFFHRNCPGSTKSRHLMDGVAEIAWYCPAGKTQ